MHDPTVIPDRTAPASEAWTVRVGSEETAAAWDPPASGRTDRVFVCAHGAGGHMSDRNTLGVSKALRDRGLGVVRFDFLYRARGSGRPDPMPRLVECLAAVTAHVRSVLAPSSLILGGRSMGGRAGSVWVAQGVTCSGLLLLAYPLHPPGQLSKLRVEHLPAIRPPVLCVNGTRDTFCDRALMERTLATLGPNWRMHWVDEADHGFHVLKRSGRNDAAVLTEIADLVDQWLASLDGPRGDAGSHA
jgi:predicted alpha/beta-hydrolase family hydrolase